MSALLAASVGALVGLGLLLVAFGCAGHRILERPSGGRSAPGPQLDRLLARSVAAGLAAVVVLGLTGWPVAAVAAGAGAWGIPPALQAAGRHRREVAMVEAIATWTEQLRDTIAGAAGLEQAIVATAPLAPTPIAPAVASLAARVGYEPLPSSLRRFAADIDHPLADFVVAALVVASDHQARNLVGLLGELATAAREDAGMRTRVWVGRARTRSAVRIIAVVVVGFVLGLVVLDRQYLAPYDDPVGQLVLAGVLTTFAVAFLLLDRLGRFAVPERFVATRATPSTGDPP
jgi:Flp pilus assembly protein TadB